MDAFDQQEKDDRCNDKTTAGMNSGVKQTHCKRPSFWSLDRAHAAIQVDISIYSVDALLRAAYKLTDRCFFLISTDEEMPHHCTVFVGMKSARDDVDPHLADFVNELLDQHLRERLEEQFGDVRTLIVAQAFSEGNLLDPRRDDREYGDDPRDITEPR